MKKTKKKIVAKKSTTPLLRVRRRTPVEEIMPEEQIIGAPFLGKVKAYDPKTHFATLELEEDLTVGDGVRVKGLATDLIQRVERIFVTDKSVQSALAGETIQLELADRVKVGDAIYKVRPV